MSSPAISIVLPFHNAATTLGRAVQSLRAQTDDDWQLLAVDDGATDGGRELLADIARVESRIRLLSPGRVGIVAALHCGCAEATAPLLARMDADDIAHPDRLAKQRAYLAAHPNTALCGTGVQAGGPVRVGRARYLAWLNALQTPEAVAREIFVECPVAHPSFLMRREIFEAVGGYQDHGWPEDYDLVLRLWKAGHAIGNLPEVLLTWTERPDRLSMNDPRYSPEAFRACKRHYLHASVLPRFPRFHQWGAGEVGKPWLREWGDRPPEGVVDIRPSKIGKRIHGIPVIPAEALPPPGETFIVVAVGTPGARDVIRAWLHPRGYLEGRDFAFLA